MSCYHLHLSKLVKVNKQYILMYKKAIFTLLILLLYTYSSHSQITPSNNKIGLDINMPQNKSFNYDSCFALGVNLGMSQVGIHQTWTALETAPNTFNLSILDIANIYYPAYNIPIDLNIDPLETNHIEVPSDLVSVAFNNSTMINRFKTLLDSVKIHIPKVTLSSLVIGSEGDIYMGNNATLWSQYKVFYDSVAAYAKTLWPGLKVATELTFSGITAYRTYAQTLNTNSDYIGVSYYPLNYDFTVKPVSTVSVDMDTVVSLYNSKPICFYQYGYPSSTSCKSSEAMQKQFITETFKSWDKHAAHIRLIDFTWLHDMDTALVSYYAKYYGLNDTSFLEFLHTLGFRTWDGNGKDKPAFVELQCQTKQRGYNTLTISCTTGISENIFLKMLLRYGQTLQQELFQSALQIQKIQFKYIIVQVC